MCAEGFCKVIRRSTAVCEALRTQKDLQLSAWIRLWFCSKLNKTQFVDVAPTLGVNHVISGVVVSCVVFCFCYLLCINKNTFDNIDHC